MAKIVIAGDVFIITSSKTLEDLKQIEKHFPDALKLKDDDEKLYFAVGTGSSNVNKNGISFNGETPDEHRHAFMRLTIPTDVADAKQYVADYVGTAFINLQKVEENLGAALQKIKENKAEVMRNIVVITDENVPAASEASAGGESDD